MYIFEYRRLRLVGRSRSSGAKRGGRRDLRAGLWLHLTRAAVRHVQTTKPVRGSLRVSVDA
jgi:hypothetical protein